MSKLFRDEAIMSPMSNNVGDIEFNRPSVLTLTVGLSIVISVAFSLLLLFGKVGRHVTLSGTIVPAGGVRQVVALRSGQVSSIQVQEGETIEKNELLLGISSQEVGMIGDSISKNIADLIHQQIIDLQQSIDILKDQERYEEDQIRSQIEYLEKELLLLSASADSALLIFQYQSKLADASNQLFGQSAISEIELSRSIGELHKVRRVAYSAELNLLSHQKLLNEKKHELNLLPGRIAEHKASLQRQISQLQQSLQQYRGQREDGILAPWSGYVSTLLVQEGDSVVAGEPLVTINESNGGDAATVKLWVPSNAVADLEAGQKVSLAVDSFPVEQFGRLTGELVNISSMPSPSQFELDSVLTEPGYYEASVDILPANEGDANRIDLASVKSGVRVSAQVELDRVSLFSHITGPLVQMYKEVF
ncbi:HlyD family secretion protein [Pseudohongiella nitratireducens]|uniref:HlyD family secretion protein n=1 Tax=Pseudohongiella nitratireducens TaxID=1768907 RepID=UPI0030ECC96A|tara:strand:- start:8641 stop:9900 length:1260 start_codon:yes stop_codon:yes gene_type:complete